MKPRTEDRQRKASLICSMVGDHVRDKREALGMTQADCSKLLAGSCESYWRSMEGGHKHMSLLRLVEVSEVLGCDASELLEGI